MPKSLAPKRRVRDRIHDFVESLPGGLLAGIDGDDLREVRRPEDVDWAAREAALSERAKAELYERRAEAEEKLRLVMPILSGLCADRSVPGNIRRLAKRVLEITQNEAIPAEIRFLHARLILYLNQNAYAREEFEFLWPPGKGALPVPDDTPWVPRPRRRARND